MLKFVKRLTNGRTGAATMIIRAEIERSPYSFHVCFPFSFYYDGGEEKMVEELEKRGWQEEEERKLSKTLRRSFYLSKLDSLGIVMALLFLDSYWDTYNFCVRKHDKWEIPLNVRHFLLIAERFARAEGDYIKEPKDNRPMTVVRILEESGFKQAATHNLKKPWS